MLSHLWASFAGMVAWKSCSDIAVRASMNCFMSILIVCAWVCDCLTTSAWSKVDAASQDREGFGVGLIHG